MDNNKITDNMSMYPGRGLINTDNNTDINVAKNRCDQKDRCVAFVIGDGKTRYYNCDYGIIIQGIKQQDIFKD